MSNITHLDDYRARRARSNVVPLHPTLQMEQIAERIARHRQAYDRLLQDLNLGWHHTCPIVGSSGSILRGLPCPYCNATEPTPPEAA